MRLQYIILILFLTASNLLFGQIEKDSSIVKKYINDTLGLTHFPDIQLLDSIKSEGKFVKWHLKETTQIIHGHSYFTTCWCPNFMLWYIIAEKENADTIVIDNIATLKSYIKDLSDKYNACLWLFISDQYDQSLASLTIPISNIGHLQFKKVSEGFLISFNSRISNAPATTGNCIYFIGKDGKVVLIKKQIIKIENYFI